MTVPHRECSRAAQTCQVLHCSCAAIFRSCPPLLQSQLHSYSGHPASAPNIETGAASRMRAQKRYPPVPPFRPKNPESKANAVAGKAKTKASWQQSKVPPWKQAVQKAAALPPRLSAPPQRRPTSEEASASGRRTHWTLWRTSPPSLHRQSPRQ